MARLVWILLFCISLRSFSQSALPEPDHIVIVIMENHSFNQIIGSKDAPTINAMVKGSHTALFTQSYGVANPSQPNYIILFSGCNQGIIDDNPPKTIPFTSDNLGRQLLDAGKTFTTYAEDLPYAGFAGETSENYVRRHNPAVYWMGNGINQLPPSVIQPLTSFPENFALLPSVCFVVPNNTNNMHDGSISQGDKWIYSHLYGYSEWAKTHNSLFILTFDEDDLSQDNRIATLISGEMVKPGSYSQKINHLNILRTIEDMFGLPYACDASKSTPVTGCWDVINSSVNDEYYQIKVVTSPGHHSITILNSTDTVIPDLKLSVIDILGVKLKEVKITSSKSTIYLNELKAGIYIYELTGHEKLLQKKKIMIP